MTIYVSGPITHHVGPDPFGPVKARLEELGYDVLNPKDVPACPDKSCTLLPHEIEKNFEHSWACYLKYDLAAMLTQCDSIFMLNGWQDSHGARLEMSTAAAVGFDILFEKDIFTPTVVDPHPDMCCDYFWATGSGHDPDCAEAEEVLPPRHEAVIETYLGSSLCDVSCTNVECGWGLEDVSRDVAADLARLHEKDA